MRTKSLSFFVVAFAMLCFAVVGGVLLTACGHQHSYTYELVEENGHSHRRVCKDCGEKEEVEECTIEVVEESDATCDEPRKIVHRCIVCNFSHTHTEGEARGHEWGDLTPLYQDDDITDDNPGEYLRQHVQYCKHDNTHQTTPVDCNFDKEETEPATCTQRGFTKHICSECGGFYITDEKPATGHEFGDWKIEEGQDGHFKHYRICTNPNCDLPGGKFVEDCADDGADMILQSFEGATCEDPSKEVFQCSKCNRQVTTHRIAALGHLYDKYEPLSQGENPTHKKICTRPLEGGGTCNDTVTEDCDCLVKVKPATCLEAGYTEHTCIFCNNTYQDNPQEKLDHKWTGFYKNQEGLHIRQCLEGNHYESHEPDYHTETTTPADCENPERKRTQCQVDGCDYVEDFLGSPATGHISSGWTHFVEDEKHIHKKSCVVCGTVLEQEECKMTSTVTAPTCEDGGFTTHTCSECAHQYEDNKTSAKGHKWSEIWNEDGDRHWRLCENDAHHIQEHLIEKSESVQLPNCTESGKLTVTCLHKEDGVQCTIESERIIEPLGHLWNVGAGTTIINEHQGHEGAKCLRPDCTETHTGAHEYTKNNFCDMCGWDGLVYSVKDGSAIVYSDRNVENVKEIVISDKTPMWNSGEEVAENQVLGGYNVVGIGIGAFQQNRNVEKITLGKNIVEIKDSAAFACPKLKTVVFNEVLQTIRATAFQYCTMLDTLVVLGADGEIKSQTKVPETITYISSSAFKSTAFENNAENWTQVTYNKSDEAQEVVGKALILHDQLLGVRLDEGKDTFEVPKEITAIAENVFSEMKNLVTVVLPSTITKIGANAFYGCDNLRSAIFRGTVAQWLGISFGNDFSSPTHYAKTFTIKETSTDLQIGNNVTTIPAGCFYGDQLESVVIGENVTSIGAGAFENCENLASITILSKKLKYIGENAFKGTKFFKNEENWDESGALYIGDYLIAVKETAEGTEERQVNENETRMVFAVKEGTTLIACGAFRNCSKLQHIEIAESVSRIGTNAFAGCKLSTLTIKDTQHDWMIWTDKIGRVLDVTDAAAVARNAPNVYVGEWYWYQV